MRWITIGCSGCSETDQSGASRVISGLEHCPHSLSTACCTDSVCSGLAILLNLLEKYPAACRPRFLGFLAIHGQFIHKVFHCYWAQDGKNLSTPVGYLMAPRALRGISRLSPLLPVLRSFKLCTVNLPLQQSGRKVISAMEDPAGVACSIGRTGCPQMATQIMCGTW
ncbi:hypothetical protein FQZ97_831830 [compost metagenome]